MYSLLACFLPENVTTTLNSFGKEGKREREETMQHMLAKRVGSG